jgi:hypothetical protein
MARDKRHWSISGQSFEILEDHIQEQKKFQNKNDTVSITFVFVFFFSIFSDIQGEIDIHHL